MPSLVSVQIFSGLICFFCIAYIILSILYPFSFQNIFGKLRFQVQHTNASTTITTTTLILSASTQSTSIHSNNSNIESYICDAVKKADKHNKTNLLLFESHRFNALRPYCDIVPTPRNNWVSAKRYTESDVVFIIYTGAKFYQSRAIATRDTWLSRVTHKYFFSSTIYSPLPVTVIEGAGEDYNSNMKKLYKGMQIAYREHNQTAKFYYLAGCDTFVNVPHVLKRLESFDYTRPSIIGGYPFGHICYKNKNQTLPGVTYPSGGAGFFLSAGMMEKMYPEIEPFFQNDWPNEEKPYSDVAINCLAKSLGVGPSFVSGFWAFTPEQTIKDSGRAALHYDPEPNTFHYVHPTSMYILDEFYVFQHIDRLANDKNLDELVKFTRKFVAVHYELLRIKKEECTLPIINQPKR